MTEVRREPEGGRGRVAIRTIGVSSGKWFVFDPQTGGYYTDGHVEHVADWLELVEP